MRQFSQRHLYCSKDPSWTDKLYICIHEISKVRKDIEMDMEKSEKENAELGKGNGLMNLG